MRISGKCLELTSFPLCGSVLWLRPQLGPSLVVQGQAPPPKRQSLWTSSKKNFLLTCQGINNLALAHSAAINRRSRCGSVRGWPVASWHCSPGLAPQVGQRTTSIFLGEGSVKLPTTELLARDRFGIARTRPQSGRSPQRRQTRLLSAHSEPWAVSGSAHRSHRKWRCRWPGLTPTIGHSPAPAEGMSLRSRRTVSIVGTSLNRGTR